MSHLQKSASSVDLAPLLFEELEEALEQRRAEAAVLREA